VVEARPARHELSGRGGVLLDHGTHLVYQLLDIPAAGEWSARGPDACGTTRYEVEDTASLRFEYPGHWSPCSSRGPPDARRTASAS